jgi:hypothetical protein
LPDKLYIKLKIKALFLMGDKTTVAPYSSEFLLYLCRYYREKLRKSHGVESAQVYFKGEDTFVLVFNGPSFEEITEFDPGISSQFDCFQTSMNNKASKKGKVSNFLESLSESSSSSLEPGINAQTPQLRSFIQVQVAKLREHEILISQLQNQLKDHSALLIENGLLLSPRARGSGQQLMDPQGSQRRKKDKECVAAIVALLKVFGKILIRYVYLFKN